MKKVILSALILAVISTGTVFAQDDFSSMPKNAISVDIGPLLAGLSFGATSSMLGGVGKMMGSSADIEKNFKTSGFGIGAQYERQLSESLSVAGRFAYMTMSTGMGLGSDNVANAGIELGISSFSIEGHVRYFFDESMFVDGMLGYANMTAGIKGSVDVDSGSSVDVDFKVPRDYLKLGIKLGWRIDPGTPGGFFFEPAFGWNIGIGFGDTIVKKTMDVVAKETNSEIPGDVGSSISDSTQKLLDAITWGIDNLIFVGGPRLVLAVGWRF